MIPRAAKLLTGFFILAVLLVVAALIFALSQPPPAPPLLPKPNGYDDLVRASWMLADKTSDYTTMNREDLRPVVETNAEALKLARTGLSRPCQVPLDYSAASPNYLLTNLAGLKRLAQGLAAEGRLMELEGRPTDAADSYLTTIRLGVASSKGGLLIHALVGIAIEAIGTSYLEKLALTLNAKQCREAAAVLETCEAGREPMPTILARERTWSRRAFRGFKWQIARLIAFKSRGQTEQRAVARVNTLQTRERVLLIRLAARAYELEKGERPKSLGDLVPAYLKAIPQNPVTGTNMAYP
jgi:hypothetical protein